VTARTLGQRITRRRPNEHRTPTRHGRMRDAITFGVFVILLILFWEWAVGFFNVRRIVVPAPSAILHALYVGLSANPTGRQSYVPHILATLKEVLAGYAVGCSFGFLLAMLTVRFRMFEVLFRPLAVALQSVPKVAIAPLMLVWFGLGFESKFALVTLATFFPLFINGITGFNSVDLGHIRMMRSFQANGGQIFRKVQFKTALPFIFAGLEISVVHAVTAAVAAELLAGQAGLGVRIIQSEQTLDVPSIFAVLVLLAIMGGCLYGTVAFVRKRVVTWTGDRLLYADQ
jgi:NitT/TauT family transport system permease protein